MKKKVSLKDIAQKLGVSIALVSYVLNDQKKGRISEAMQRKIKETARKMDYRPNQIAKSLKTRKTFTIGLIVADIANPFSSSLARIIEDEAEKKQYTVIFGSSDENPEKSRRLVDVFRDRQVDGLIIAPTEESEDQIRSLQKSGIPLVLIDRYFSGLKANYVVIDNYEAAYTGVSHLIQQGYQRIGMIGFKTGLLHLKDRQKGYKAAMKKAALPVKKEWVREVAMDHTTRQEVEASISGLLSGEDPVEALFFASNKVSTYGLSFLNSNKVRVPQQVGVLNFDQTEAAELFYTPLTHIRQPLQQIGEEAVRILMQSMEKPRRIEQLQLKALLIPGQSTTRR